MSYGVPNGSAINYGAPGFPDWVYQLGNAFSLRASTYPGHQENDRIEDGYARNPQRLNRGIDWAGSVENMQRFAEYCFSIRGALEQVIWQNPIDGRRIGVAGGRDVTNTSYFAADYGGHTDHVHTRQSEPIPMPGDWRPDPVDVLWRAVPVINIARARELLPLITAGLQLIRARTPKAIAMFLAQMGHESDGFNTTQEYGSGQRYAPYIGRTWVQITWDYNYRQFGQWCAQQGLLDDPEFFIKNPARLADPQWAGVGPAWYCTVKEPRYLEYADAGDVENASKAINAPAWIGTPNRANGIPDRINRYNQAIALGDQLLALTTTDGDDFMAALNADEQREMLELLRWLAAPGTGELRKRFPSRSPLRHLGEGDIDTAVGILLNDDANDHVALVIDLARIGQPQALALLNEVASADPVKYPDRQQDAQLARRILESLKPPAPALPPVGPAPAALPAPALPPAPTPVQPPPPPAAVPRVTCALNGGSCALVAAPTTDGKCALGGGGCAVSQIGNPK